MRDTISCTIVLLLMLLQSQGGCCSQNPVLEEDPFAMEVLRYEVRHTEWLKYQLNEPRLARTLVDEESGAKRHTRKFEHVNPMNGFYTKLDYDLVMSRQFVDIENMEYFSDIICEALDSPPNRFNMKLVVHRRFRALFESNFQDILSVDVGSKLSLSNKRWSCLKNLQYDGVLLLNVTGTPTDLLAASSRSIEFEAQVVTDFMQVLGNSKFQFFSNDSLNEDLKDKKEYLRRYDVREEYELASWDPVAAFEELMTSPKAVTRISFGWNKKQGITLVEFNRDQVTGEALTDPISPFQSSFGSIECDNCFAYAGGGVGYEFEVIVHFDSDPIASLAYMKIWAEAVVQLNVAALATFQAGTNSGGSTTTTDLIAGQTLATPWTKDTPYSRTHKLGVPISVKYVVGSLIFTPYQNVYFNVEINGNIKGQAWAMATFQANVQYGKAFIGSDCTMDGCIALRGMPGSQCYNLQGDWCDINTMGMTSGTGGPYWSFQGSVHASLALIVVPAVLVSVSALGQTLSLVDISLAIVPAIIADMQLPSSSCSNGNSFFGIGVAFQAFMRVDLNIKLPLDIGFTTLYYDIYSHQFPALKLMDWDMSLFRLCLPIPLYSGPPSAKLIITGNSFLRMQIYIGPSSKLVIPAMVSITSGSAGTISIDTLLPSTVQSSLGTSYLLFDMGQLQINPVGVTFSSSVLLSLGVTLDATSVSIPNFCSYVVVMQQSTTGSAWNPTVVQSCQIQSEVSKMIVVVSYTTLPRTLAVAARRLGPPRLSPNNNVQIQAPATITASASQPYAVSYSLVMEVRKKDSPNGDPLIFSSSSSSTISFPLDVTYTGTLCVTVQLVAAASSGYLSSLPLTQCYSVLGAAVLAPPSMGSSWPGWSWGFGSSSCPQIPLDAAWPITLFSSKSTATMQWTFSNPPSSWLTYSDPISASSAPSSTGIITLSVKAQEPTMIASSVQQYCMNIQPRPPTPQIVVDQTQQDLISVSAPDASTGIVLCNVNMTGEQWGIRLLLKNVQNAPSSFVLYTVSASTAPDPVISISPNTRQLSFSNSFLNTTCQMGPSSGSDCVINSFYGRFGIFSVSMGYQLSGGMLISDPSNIILKVIGQVSSPIVSPSPEMYALQESTNGVIMQISCGTSGANVAYTISEIEHSVDLPVLPSMPMQGIVSCDQGGLVSISYPGLWSVLLEAYIPTSNSFITNSSWTGQYSIRYRLPTPDTSGLEPVSRSAVPLNITINPFVNIRTFSGSTYLPPIKLSVVGCVTATWINTIPQSCYSRSSDGSVTTALFSPGNFYTASWYTEPSLGSYRWIQSLPVTIHFLILIPGGPPLAVPMPSFAMSRSGTVAGPFSPIPMTAVMGKYQDQSFPGQAAVTVQCNSPPEFDISLYLAIDGVSSSINNGSNLATIPISKLGSTYIEARCIPSGNSTAFLAESVHSGFSVNVFDASAISASSTDSATLNLKVQIDPSKIAQFQQSLPPQIATSVGIAVSRISVSPLTPISAVVPPSRRSTSGYTSQVTIGPPQGSWDTSTASSAAILLLKQIDNKNSMFSQSSVGQYISTATIAPAPSAPVDQSAPEGKSNFVLILSLGISVPLVTIVIVVLALLYRKKKARMDRLLNRHRRSQQAETAAGVASPTAPQSNEVELGAAMSAKKEDPEMVFGVA